jgi:ABC-type uncharacterized transport system substrate-binding protein
MKKAAVPSTLIAAIMLAVAVVADAQQTGKMFRIGFLSTSSSRDPSLGMRSVRRELLALGYAEGKNIAYEYRYAEDKPERTPALADELVRLKVDVIVAGGDGDTQAAKSASATIPIVFLESISDPVALGLVKSLARPGENITGFTTVADVLAGKRLQLLKETLPKLSRAAILWNPESQTNETQWKESQQVAQKLGLQVHSMEVSSANQYENAFKKALNARSDALAVTRTRLSNVNQKRIIELAAKNRLPAIYYREDFVENGGLMAYGADEAEPFRRVAVMIDKILKGTKPADIPVEQPKKFELIINLKAAKEIGLTIPPNVLVRADRVIK